jgi:hypothetical protein
MARIQRFLYKCSSNGEGKEMQLEWRRQRNAANGEGKEMQLMAKAHF